jgi:hypothetical protein
MGGTNHHRFGDAPADLESTSTTGMSRFQILEGRRVENSVSGYVVFFGKAYIIEGEWDNARCNQIGRRWGKTGRGAPGDAVKKTFNAKTPRREGATILNILLQFLDVTIWLAPVLRANAGISHAPFAPLPLCALALNFLRSGGGNGAKPRFGPAPQSRPVTANQAESR